MLARWAAKRCWRTTLTSIMCSRVKRFFSERTCFTAAKFSTRSNGPAASASARPGQPAKSSALKPISPPRPRRGCGYRGRAGRDRSRRCRPVRAGPARTPAAARTAAAPMVPAAPTTNTLAPASCRRSRRGAPPSRPPAPPRTPKGRCRPPPAPGQAWAPAVACALTHSAARRAAWLRSADGVKSEQRFAARRIADRPVDAARRPRVSMDDAGSNVRRRRSIRSPHRAADAGADVDRPPADVAARWRARPPSTTSSNADEVAHRVQRPHAPPQGDRPAFAAAALRRKVGNTCSPDGTGATTLKIRSGRDVRGDRRKRRFRRPASRRRRHRGGPQVASSRHGIRSGEGPYCAAELSRISRVAARRLRSPRRGCGSAVTLSRRKRLDAMRAARGMDDDVRLDYPTSAVAIRSRRRPSSTRRPARVGQPRSASPRAASRRPDRAAEEAARAGDQDADQRAGTGPGRPRSPGWRPRSGRAGRCPSSRRRAHGRSPGRPAPSPRGSGRACRRRRPAGSGPASGARAHRRRN